MNLSKYETSPKGCLYIANNKITCIHKGEYLGHIGIGESGREVKNEIENVVLFTHRIDFENDYCVFVKDFDESLISEI